MKTLTFGATLALVAAAMLAAPVSAKPTVIDEVTLTYDDADTFVEDPDSCNDNDNSEACNAYCNASGYANKACTDDDCTGDDSCNNNSCNGSTYIDVMSNGGNCNSGDDKEEPTSAPGLPLSPAWLDEVIPGGAGDLPTLP